MARQAPPTISFVGHRRAAIATTHAALHNEPMRVAIVEVGTTRAAGIREGLAALDESDEESIGASVDAGVSAYVANGLAPRRIRPLLDLAVRRFQAFARLLSDLAEAKSKLAERDAIDRAKRILMDQRPADRARGLRRTAAHRDEPGPPHR